MMYRRLDTNGDYSFGRGKQDFIAGAAAVAQAIKTRLLLLLEEWWEDQTDGTPLFQEVLGVSGTPENINAIDLVIQDRIITTENVLEIVSYESDYENRNYSMQCTVNTTFGTVEVNL